nr:tetraacyldisaccharide 4'-kinase [Marinomonas algarum]
MFTRSWYSPSGWTQVFRPLQPWVRRVVTNKRHQFLAHPEQSYRAPVPVVVVGNISVGGTGKSPMVVALCQLLIAHGYRPGIVSRGHGANITTPTYVTENSLPSEVGDEPVMLARRTGCPLVVFAKRVEAVKYLLAASDVNVVICDDGMQHYALNRDIEIAMLDAKRGVGNGQLLPVGPLREPVERLSDVDFVVSVGHSMTPALESMAVAVKLATLMPTRLMSLDGERQLALKEAFIQQPKWHIMAGIGNPERFMDTLEGLGLSREQSSHRWFADHHQFVEADVPDHGAVIMTEKDAVKCQSLALVNKDIWYLSISLVLPETVENAFLERLSGVQKTCENSKLR